MRILVFGDSIAQGFLDLEGGWVWRLQKYHIQNQIETTIFNLGISGDTSAKVCQRFQTETDARKFPGEDFTFVFAVGVNDACLEEGKPWATPEQYKQNVIALIEMAQKYSPRILIVGLTPCDDDKTVPTSWGDFNYKNEDITKLDNILREVCNEQNVDFVSVSEAFEGREKELLSDGLHPNGDGHELIANLVASKLEKLIK